ncbi:hypothetical protein JQX13_31735 [Archangium violaceum]|uniref:hypothetical protein n=1 Tax=Archangium violaceum TaxID=83451 RepID=UPI00193B1E6B|nr:hypothetical protein [Archangium violaceum]QRK04781.1 hypothetical protein JQX13_31735 [Archangium violaceum]
MSAADLPRGKCQRWPSLNSTRVGWGWRLRQDNFRMRDGQPPDVLTDTAISLIQHGGFLFSGTLGVSFF